MKVVILLFFVAVSTLFGNISNPCDEAFWLNDKVIIMWNDSPKSTQKKLVSVLKSWGEKNIRTSLVNDSNVTRVSYINKNRTYIFEFENGVLIRCNSVLNTMNSILAEEFYTTYCTVATTTWGKPITQQSSNFKSSVYTFDCSKLNKEFNYTETINYIVDGKEEDAIYTISHTTERINH